MFLMKKKSKALDKFKEFKAESKKQLGRHIKSLCSDRGSEYMSIEFVTFLKEDGILSQFSAIGTCSVIFVLYKSLVKSTNTYKRMGRISNIVDLQVQISIP